MTNLSSQKERILQFIEYKKISKNKFYIETGISNGILDKKGGLSMDTVEKFYSKYPEINPEWIITGKGKMLKTDLDDKQNNDVANIVKSKLSDNTYTDLSEIDYLKQKSPIDLKNETKLFLMNYRQRLLDSLQLLMSLSKALKYLGYEFSEKEITEIIYYDDFVENVKTMEEKQETVGIELRMDLINMLDRNLFGIINKYTYKIDTLIGDDGVHEWQDLLKKE